jgi:hypothetical protein
MIENKVSEKLREEKIDPMKNVKIEPTINILDHYGDSTTGRGKSQDRDVIKNITKSNEETVAILKGRKDSSIHANTRNNEKLKPGGGVHTTQSNTRGLEKTQSMPKMRY